MNTINRHPRILAIVLLTFAAGLMPALPAQAQVPKQHCVVVLTPAKVTGSKLHSRSKAWPNKKFRPFVASVQCWD